MVKVYTGPKIQIRDQSFANFSKSIGTIKSFLKAKGSITPSNGAPYTHTQDNLPKGGIPSLVHSPFCFWEILLTRMGNQTIRHH